MTDANDPAPPFIANLPAARRFHDSVSARIWADREFASWARSLPPGERRALAVYKADGKFGDALERYREINGALRGHSQKPWTSNAKRYVPLISQATNRHTLSEAIVVWRGIPERDLPPWPIAPGSEFVEPAFMSTSLARDVAREYARRRRPSVLAEITLPAGTPTAFIDLIGVMKRELEILLPAGAVVAVDSLHVDQAGERHIVGHLSGFSTPS